MGLIHIILDEETNEELFRFKSSEKEKRIDNFVWFFYEDGKEIFDGKLKNTDIFDVFKLATYMNYNNIIVNDNFRPIIEKEGIKKITGFKDKKFFQFMKNCKNAGIIKVDNDGKYHISKEYFSKGKCETPKRKQRIKIFCSSIRNLKLNENNNGKRFMANIYRLIPYIGDEFNILYDKSSGYENPMSIKDVLKKLGYLSSKYLLREKNKLFNLEFDGNKIIKVFYEDGEERVAINPKIFCKTNDIPYTPVASSQQKHIAKLLNGDLNYRISNYFLDIYLKKENICIEYDGSGHNLSILFGSKTEEEFIEDEKVRENDIISHGIKIIRLISKKDKLPNDTEMLEIIDECKDKLLTNNIVRYSFDSMSFI